MEENIFEKVAFKLFGSYKKSLVSLFVLAVLLAIPITLSLVQQQQVLQQNAASTNMQVMINSVSTVQFGNSSIPVSVNALPPTTNSSLYIMKVNSFTDIPQSGTRSVGYYEDNINNLQLNTFYKIKNYTNGNALLPMPPAGNYFLAVNAYENSATICSWDGNVYVIQNGQTTLSNPLQKCQNSLFHLTVTASSSGPTPNNITLSLQPDPTSNSTSNNLVSTSIGGQYATGYRRYIYYQQDPSKVPDPTKGNTAIYDPKNPTPNTILYIDSSPLPASQLTSIITPQTPGRYFVLVNAYDNNGHICAWDGQLWTNGVAGTKGSCNTNADQVLTVNSSSTPPAVVSPEPTNGQVTTTPGYTPPISETVSTTPPATVTQTQGNQNPTGSITTTPGQNTPAPNNTMSPNQLAVAVQLPGIGNGPGDNSNPQHPTRDIEAFIYDTSNNLVKDIHGNVTFDGKDTYTGNLDLGNTFQSGYYIVKLRMNNTLTKLVPGIQNIQASGVNTSPAPTTTPTPTPSTCPYPFPISLFLCRSGTNSQSTPTPTQSANTNTSGTTGADCGGNMQITPTCAVGYTCQQSNPDIGGHCVSSNIQAQDNNPTINVTQLPTVTLVPGDLSQDNVMDIKDYNDFISCFGNKQCDTKQQADFNDDGVVDGTDYNILLRGFAIHEGD